MSAEETIRDVLPVLVGMYPGFETTETYLRLKEAAGCGPPPGGDRFGSPWSLDFGRDGTEDFAVIRDADGYVLATSRQFWLPEENDPVPVTLAAVRLMATAPLLRDALDYLLAQTVDQDLKHGITLTEGEEDARREALAALEAAEAACGSPAGLAKPREPWLDPEPRTKETTV